MYIKTIVEDIEELEACIFYENTGEKSKCFPTLNCSKHL